MFRQQKAVHEDLASSLPRDKVAEWEATPLDAAQGPNKKWSSPLMDPVWTGNLKNICDVCIWFAYNTIKKKMDRFNLLYKMSLRRKLARLKYREGAWARPDGFPKA
jgi:hypothetical protein